MLPLIVYSADKARSDAVSGMLERCIASHELPAQMDRRLSTPGQLEEFAARCAEAMACFLCCEQASLAAEPLLAVRCYDRDSYAVVVAGSPKGLQEILRPSTRLSALLLEPVKPGRLRTLLEELIEDSLQPHKAASLSFEVKAKGHRYYVSAESILFFEARNKRLLLRTAAQQIEFSGTLQSLEGRLPESFLRVHNAFIVNLARIVSVDYKTRQITFPNGLAVSFSRTYRPVLQSALGARAERRPV